MLGIFHPGECEQQLDHHIDDEFKPRPHDFRNASFCDGWVGLQRDSRGQRRHRTLRIFSGVRQTARRFADGWNNRKVFRNAQRRRELQLRYFSFGCGRSLPTAIVTDNSRDRANHHWSKLFFELAAKQRMGGLWARTAGFRGLLAFAL